MKRYIKGVLGGVLAILAAFGWTAAIYALILLKSNNTIVGIYVSKAPQVLIPVLLIFCVGFYLAFRTTYSTSGADRS